MKTTLILLILCSINVIVSGQSTMFNLNAGSWKKAQTWSYNRVPNDTDDVVLINDIQIDQNATCRSLTTNGYNVIVLPGYRVTITGRDSAVTADADTLIAGLTVLYAGDSASYDQYNLAFKTYQYDAQKRVSGIITDDGDVQTTAKYFYNGNSRLPYKTTFYNPCDYTSDGNCIIRTDTSFYTYNADGFVVLDSSRSVENELSLPYLRVYGYEINGDSVQRYGSFNLYSVSINASDTSVYEYFEKDTVYYQRTLNNGNIIYQYATKPGSWHSEHIFEQDTHKNPLYASTIHFPVLPLEMLLFESPEQPNNNILHQEDYTFEGIQQNLNYRSAYRYKPNGYPSELIMYNVLDETFFVIRYEYTH